MRLYEYEAKRIFKRQGVSVPAGVVIGRENMGDLDRVVYPVVIKAQAFVGGRGKAGLVQSAGNRAEAQEMILNMLGRDHAGHKIDRVLIEQKVTVKRELYLAVIVDRLEHMPLIMSSQRGGMDIEEIARTKSTPILKYYLNPGAHLNDFMARNVASNLGLRGLLLKDGADTVHRLYRLFVDYDCKVAEINPLVLTDDDRILALDAKVDLDEDAMFRHPQLIQMGIAARHEVGEMTEREKFAKRAGIPYVDLDGDIGVFPGGAGFGIASIDLIQHYGGKPANFMDSGGAPTQEKLRAMLGLLLDNPGVKAIFGARFGGISRCDDWAKAVVQFIVENRPQKPMIMRMAGNMEEEGRKIIEKAKVDHPELFKKIKVYAYDTPIEEVIKETIRSAQTEKK
ncbi:MAG: acetate--CoA ligase family protein [candidate division WOR-3 bacterium]|nr:MAG: acetate--CoA ligase family protein [candidate division WOR-3 bacterium]